MNWSLFAAYLAVTLILFITPGPMVTLVVTTAARHGVRAGLATVIGGTLGMACVMVGVAFGLNWVLAHVAALFDVLRWVGALYLAYLGVQAWRGAGHSAQTAASPERAQFARGFFVGLTNPKTIVFFTAFLPQFVDPALPAGRQLAAMCVAALALALTTDTAWAVAGGMSRAWLTSPRRATIMRRVTGAVLFGGGIWLSIARRPVG